MKRYFLIICLVAAVLACEIPVTRVQPTTTPAATKLTATATRQIKSTATRSAAWTVKVRQPIVNVRSSADGDPTGKYLTVGKYVTVLRCVDNWCEIEDPAGWVFRGCLSDNPDNLGCEAK